MAILSAEEIYRVAREAGFTPDQAVTFTAIALAESSGRTDALASKGEHSIGLWQINVAPNVRSNVWGDLTDPATNARAAYQISSGGTKLKPWSVTHGGNAGTSRDYRSYLDEATAARASIGDNLTEAPAISVQAAVVDSDRDGVTDEAEVALSRSPSEADVDDAVGQAAAEAHASHASSQPLERFLEVARAQAGDRYVYGAEAEPEDADPDSFDCSELVQWAAAQAGVEITDGAKNQYLALKAQGMLIPVEEAERTPGALLFRLGSQPHVAISLGNGSTIEARGRAYGVAEFSARGRFQYAAVIPGLSGSAVTAPGSVASYDVIDPGLAPWLVDQDLDGLVDGAEVVVGTSPTAADTDADGVADAAEVMMARTNPLVADSDGDGYDDGTELAFDSDPLHADSADPWGQPVGTTPLTGGGSTVIDAFGNAVPALPKGDDKTAEIIKDLMT